MIWLVYNYLIPWYHTLYSFIDTIQNTLKLSPYLKLLIKWITLKHAGIWQSVIQLKHNLEAWETQLDFPLIVYINEGLLHIVHITVYLHLHTCILCKWLRVLSWLCQTSYYWHHVGDYIFCTSLRGLHQTSYCVHYLDNYVTVLIMYTTERIKLFFIYCEHHLDDYTIVHIVYITEMITYFVHHW